MEVIKMKRIIYLALLASFISSSYIVPKAHALSCAAPEITIDTIKDYKIIFDGTVSKIEKVKFRHGFENPNVRIYHFKINKLWKGQPGISTAKLLAPPGWAQEWAYEKGGRYIVFGSDHELIKNKVGYYFTRPGWCGLDVLGLEHANQKLKLLIEKEE
jgi:hypothetical protein